jgi:aspartate beta-hydroxylase
MPGAHITAHCGPSNVSLTLHLGLSVPPETEIRVGDETRRWQEGKCLVLDDSFEHEVWNRGERTRFILLLEVWHPDLTEVEKRFLSWAMLAAAEADGGTGTDNAPTRHRDDLKGKTWWK